MTPNTPSEPRINWRRSGPAAEAGARDASYVALRLPWAVAPLFAGIMMEAGGLGLPLIFAGVTKLTYDFLLWREFRRVKPPEELKAAE